MSCLPFPSIFPGTTCLIALLSDKELTVANVGDSRGVLCDKDGNAIPLSHDHKPYQLKERKRIKRAGESLTFCLWIEGSSFFSVNKIDFSPGGGWKEPGWGISRSNLPLFIQHFTVVQTEKWEQIDLSLNEAVWEEEERPSSSPAGDRPHQLPCDLCREKINEQEPQH